MKKISKLLLMIPVLGLAFTSCTKNVEENKNEVSDETLAQIKRLGFSTKDVQKVAEGYLVEKDIILTHEQLSDALPSTPNMIIAQEEQYRTYNLVNTSKYSTITIALDNSSAQHQAAFSAALDEAVNRYNAQNLAIRFQRISSRADITVTAYYQVSNTLGSAGFPGANGTPYRQIKMNTYWYETGTGSTNVNYIATIMAHEMGHCIGFRHTDYMNRSYSCGGSGGNEGSGSVGAVHIPGTPTGPDANSWMLACIGEGVNRPFNSNDKVALNYVY